MRKPTVDYGTCPLQQADWDKLPRLLQDLCEGHGAYMMELYALDRPGLARTWLCAGCYSRAYIAAGRPPQHSRACPPGCVIAVPA